MMTKGLALRILLRNHRLHLWTLQLLELGWLPVGQGQDVQAFGYGDWSYLLIVLGNRTQQP